MEIGKALHDSGGMNAMLQAHKVFEMKRGHTDARRLEHMWGGIGGHQGWLG